MNTNIRAYVDEPASYTQTRPIDTSNDDDSDDDDDDADKE